MSTQQVICTIVFTLWLDLKGMSKREETMTFPEFVEWLKSRPSVEIKADAPLIKLSRFGNKKSDKGCLRTNANVLEMYGIEGDGDNGKLTVDEVKTRLENANIRAIILTTHSHTTQHPRWRVLCPLSQPTDNSERRRLVARLNGVLDGHLASESFTASQSYFVGGKPGAEYRVECTFDDPDDGYFIDQMDELDVLANYGTGADEFLGDWEDLDIVIDEYRSPPQEKVECLRENDPRFASSMDRTRTDLKDSSASGYDLSLATIAAQAGWNPQEIADLLVSCRLKHGDEIKRLEYFQRTIGKALADAKEQCSSRNAKHEKMSLAAKLMEQHNIANKDIHKAASEDQKGCAWLALTIFKERFCYDHAANLWYSFRKHFWQLEVIETPIQRLDELQALFELVLSSVASEIAKIEIKIAKSDDKIEISTLKKKIGKLKKQSASLDIAINSLNRLHFREQVLKFATKGPNTLGIAGEEWDLHPTLLAFQNGLLDLETGEFRAGRQDDYIKTVCPHPYDPQALCPVWEKFLLDVFDNDPELVDYIQRLLGFCTSGLTTEHILPVFWGAGRNGKGTILETMGYVWPGRCRLRCFWIRARPDPLPDQPRTSWRCAGDASPGRRKRRRERKCRHHASNGSPAATPWSVGHHTENAR